MNQTQIEQLIITRDGELDKDYLRQQQLQRIGNTITNASQSLTGAVSSFIGNVVHNVSTEAHLAVTDTLYGTELRQERHQQLHDQRVASIREKFKLV